MPVPPRADERTLSLVRAMSHPAIDQSQRRRRRINKSGTSGQSTNQEMFKEHPFPCLIRLFMSPYLAPTHTHTHRRGSVKVLLIITLGAAGVGGGGDGGKEQTRPDDLHPAAALAVQTQRSEKVTTHRVQSSQHLFLVFPV